MNWAAKILLIGILAIASISVMGAAIAIAAPYIATLIILWLAGKFLLSWFPSQEPED